MMKSRFSSILEKTLLFQILFALVFPVYFVSHSYLDQRDLMLLLNMILLILSALSFRKVWIQVITTGVISYLGLHLDIRMFFFHWLTSFFFSAFILTLIGRYLSEKQSTIDLIKSLANSLDSRDEYTAHHSRNVAHYSRAIAMEMNLSTRRCENLYFGGLLHDIGKIGVPENILNKPSKLTNEEFLQIKQHPLIGFNLVKHIKRFKHNGIHNMILYHHERYDGKGYPYGLKGNEIPLEARIMAVADAFDAMTSRRIYRSHIELSTVIKILKENRGTQFDPAIVNTFLDVLENESYARKPIIPPLAHSSSLGRFS